VCAYEKEQVLLLRIRVNQTHRLFCPKDKRDICHHTTCCNFHPISISPESRAERMLTAFSHSSLHIKKVKVSIKYIYHWLSGIAQLLPNIFSVVHPLLLSRYKTASLCLSNFPTYASISPVLQLVCSEVLGTVHLSPELKIRHGGHQKALRV